MFGSSQGRFNPEPTMVRSPEEATGWLLA